MKELFIQAETLQNLLISQATGGKENNAEFTRLRQFILSNAAFDTYIPKFIKTCRSLDQFWQFIKYELDILERGGPVPSDEFVSKGVKKINAAHVQAAWLKSLDRRSSDPEGAITSARTLIETVCKHILDDMGVKYDDTVDLPKLYKKTADILNLAPSQHTAEVFKQILGGCTAIIEGLGTLRNRLSDAHGKGKMGVKPAPRHAELAVNLSGALASYLLATWEARKETST